MGIIFIQDSFTKKYEVNNNTLFFQPREYICQMIIFSWQIVYVDMKGTIFRICETLLNIGINDVICMAISTLTMRAVLHQEAEKHTCHYQNHHHRLAVSSITYDWY